jgi:membrane protein
MAGPDAAAGTERRGRVGAALAEPFRFVAYASVRFWNDHCFSKAASLSFSALFAIVPMLAVGLAILGAFPQLEPIRAQLLKFVVSYVLPPNVPDFEATLNSFLANTQGLTAVGTIALAVTAIILLDTIETYFNQIWRQTAVRPLLARVVMFWAIMTMTPLLVGGSMALSTLIVESGGIGVLGFDGIVAALVWLAPMVLLVAAFALSYLFIPYRRVRVLHAVVGALLAAALFQALRWAFTEYVKAVPTYKTVYGALAVIPIFLLYVYAVQCVVLYGAEIAASLPEWRRRPGAGRERGSALARRLLAALLMLDQLFRARASGDPIRGDVLADIAADALADADRGAAQHIIDRLLKARLVGRADSGGWYLSRDPATVRLGDLLDVLDLQLAHAGDLDFLRPAWGDAAAEALGRAGSVARDYLVVDLETLFSAGQTTLVTAAPPAKAAAE